MQFPPNPSNELIIPAGVPFLPGNDVIGLGTELPPELAAFNPVAGGPTVTAAMVFYTSAYNPAATTPQTKYFFIAIAGAPNGEAAITLGAAIVANPSVSQTAVITSGFVLDVFDGDIEYTYASADNNAIAVIADDAMDNGTVAIVNSLGNITAEMSANAGTSGGGLVATFDSSGTSETGHIG
jgi:hypothetical protein